ncbi:Kinase D-interacting substrate of 220 kDa [Acipenser ruthenus]|uniref:Kinase D-interacting substrate of 220 kDa n=1 Tax=Acipenser ruthenus TaxID=7906 RepID=A0A662YQB7_ACIRT|nr:Kinase D-interacting substrate of 220 kDa [Acipenser ruthenus]
MASLVTRSLLSFVEEENMAEIRAFLEKCKEVDERNENGQTPLMLAAEQGNLEIVQELLKKGANINLEDADNWTALISASKEGHIDVVKELLRNDANLEHRDSGGWTALMWAAYKGRTEVTSMLLEKGSNPNITGQQYSVYPIIWAAGRGHAEIVHLLLEHGAKVNCSDKYGTTPLIWAARKGHYDSVMHLLENGADVDQEGANSMTALIVAVKSGYTDMVKELLKRNPNVNMTDKDGNTALMIAAKEGHTEIVQDLLDAGTYVNIPDRSGDTVLIGAVRGGHVEIVRALLQKYADIDIRGQDNKTALYWAVEKGNATMVRDILQCNPDTEICTKDGETTLIKATKMRNIDIVELLLDKGARVSAVDKKGDTPLHIAIRGRSRKLAELLLRNPKDGRLLYRPNKAGETPYNIDCTHQKSILTQIFGARHLSPSESDGDMLGYDLYSSALADILSEPTMQPPICVGLYAQWGSGKSFLLKKLEDEMKTFAGQQIEPLFQFSWLVVFLTLLLCGAVGLLLAFVVDLKLGIAVGLSLLAVMYISFVVVYFGGRREGESWNWAWVLSTRLARHIGYLELLLKLMFVNPPELPEQTTRALPVRFLFTDYNRLSSVGGETSMAEMIATLSDACEREFGFLATRLFRVFKTEDSQGKKKWKKTCCVPSFVIFLFILGCLITGITLLAIFKVDEGNMTVNAVLISMACAIGLALILNCRTWWQVLDSILNSQRKRLHSAANKMQKLKSEGFMKVLKCEVELMARMAKAIDGFTQNQTRLAVIIDGLDACEQDKVLQMLDTVRILFSKGPFIAIFASDPHIIIKAINQNLNSVLRDSNINGHDYMRNIVHLPVFLNSRGLSSAKKLLVAAPTNGDVTNSEGWHEDTDRKLSQHSLGELTKIGSKTALNRRDTYRRRQMQRTVTRQMSFDLTKLLVTEDWFSDISPQTMRRLLNIVSVTVHVFFSTHMHKISKNIPTTKDVEPLLEIDGDIRSFEVFLASRTPVLTVRDIKTFLPCTVNLDPKLREIIAVKTVYPRDQNNGLGAASAVSGVPMVLLSSMNVDAVCERLKLIEGIDQSMLPQYTTTIKKANVNGRVLSQCNLDELKKEMSMNFGDWQLFRGTVMELRHLENQAIHEDSRAVSEQGSSVIGHSEPVRRQGPPAENAVNPDGTMTYSLNFSFEELSTVGLDEPTHRTPSMSSLNSQESSNEICKLTDKQQAEYRDAYKEYIASMAQLEATGNTGEKPVQPHPAQFIQSASGVSLHSNLEEKGKDGEQDGRKPFMKRDGNQRSGKPSDMVDYTSSAISTADTSPLDPITEEDEKPDHAASKLLGKKPSSERINIFHGADLKLKGVGLRYQKLTSDEDESGNEESDNTPLLKEGKERSDSESADRRPSGKGKEYMSDAMLDKKDSSDSGVRSNESSPNHSLQDEEADVSQLEKANLIELDEDTLARKRGLPRSLSELQDPAIARMSICSEDKKSPSECSLIASSPEESWPPSQKAYNLNRTASNTTLNNNSNTPNQGQSFDESEGTRRDSRHMENSVSQILIHPGSSTHPTAVQNENLKGIHLKRGVTGSYNRHSKEGASPELHTVASSDTVRFGEERESIL